MAAFGFFMRVTSLRRDVEQMEKVRLGIAQIAPGMKLAEAITNASGVTLMPAGIRLTPMFIARIRKWNIETLEVLVEKKRSSTTTMASLPVQQTPGQKQAREQALTAEQEEFARATALEISRPFVNVKDNPVMMQLRAAVIRRLVQLGPQSPVNILRHPPGLDGEGA